MENQSSEEKHLKKAQGKLVVFEDKKICRTFYKGKVVFFGYRYRRSFDRRFECKTVFQAVNRA